MVKIFINALMILTLSGCVKAEEKNLPNNALLNGLASNLNHVASFQTDLNSDGRKDLVFHVVSGNVHKLVVLVSNEFQFNTFILLSTSNVYITRIKYADNIEYLIPQNEKKKVLDLQKVYIDVKYPEGPNIIYFWNENKNDFEEKIVTE